MFLKMKIGLLKNFDMTEHQIEIQAERKMDRLDEQYLKGFLSEQEYKKAIKEINIWVDEKLNMSKRNYK